MKLWEENKAWYIENKHFINAVPCEMAHFLFIAQSFYKSKNVLAVSKGPGAKNDTSENPGCFNQILSFESRKGSPAATFEFLNNESALGFLDFRLFHLQKQVLTQIVMF